MMTKRDLPQTEADKQWQPMPGEVALKDARRMAPHFAVVEKLALDTAAKTSASQFPATKAVAK